MGLRDTISSLVEAERFADAQAALAQISDFSSADFALLAQICKAQENFQCTADALIQQSILAGFDAADLPEDIHEQIWGALSRAPTGPQVFTHRYHLAWWQLQQSVRESGSLTAQIRAWQDWKDNNPSHPAALRPPLSLTQLDNYRAPNIAVLLPLSGRLGGAGRAVQDGIVAGYLDDEAETKIKFYDTELTPLGQLLEQALTEGADVVVGPLRKDRAQSFSELAAMAEVPNLVLNYLDNDAPTDTDSAQYQFGIAIEDEAISLAQHVLLAGYSKVALVHGQDPWAIRARDAYLDTWHYPVTPASFDEVKNLTAAVGAAMQISQSEERRQEIANIIGAPVEFLPRARQDLEAIVAFTNNVESRALIPALRFHFGDHLPVYTTSQATRRGDAEALAGFYLSDMPLFVEQQKFQSLHDTFALTSNPLVELYALGFDAYRVATWLPVLTPRSQITTNGASGYIWLDQGGVFRRELGLGVIADNGDIEAR